MRNLWVYDSGTWKQVIVAYVYNENSVSWKQANDTHVYRHPSYEKVLDTADFYVPSAATVLSLLKAASGIPPQSTYWNTLTGSGQKLGDINGSGSITSADSTIMSNYVVNPASVTSLQRYWIEFEIIPYATGTPPP
ncbi:hypothetical protein EBT31_08315 [bacterium]|nr:hypothetical protein [bacterium]